MFILVHIRLTARAEIHAIDLDQKERKRRQKEEEMERGEYGRRESRELSLGDGEYGGGAGEGNEVSMLLHRYGEAWI